MRDKPNDDMNFGKPADEKPDVEKQASGADAAASEPAAPRFPEDPPFRVREQFSDLDNIPPAMARNAGRPTKASVPGGALADTAQPGRSIRHDVSFQDFFRNLDIIKIVRGIYRKFWIILLSAFALMLLLIPAARSLQGGVAYSAESVIIYSKPTQKQIDTQGSSFLLRPLTQDTLVDMFLSPANIKALEEATGLKPLEKNVSFDSQSKSDIVTLRVSDMPTEAEAISAVNRLAEIIITKNADYYRELATTAYNNYKTQREETEKQFNKAAQDVEEFQLKNQLLELTTQYQNYFSSVNAATERLSIAQVAHEGLVVRIKNYEKMVQELPEEVLSEAQEDNPLKGRISNAEAALLQAQIQFAPDNPKVLQQKREIEELRKLLQSGSYDETRERTYVKNPLKGQIEGELLKLRAEEEVAVQQVESLKKDLATLEERFKDLPRLEKEYAALLEKRAQLDGSLKTLKASEDSARLTLASNLSDFKLMSVADSAEATAASLIGRIIPIAGFIFGFFGGLILVILIELLDAKVRTQQQLENAYEAPCLASIIEIPRLEEYDTYKLLLPSLREISERLNVVLRGRRAKVLGFFSSQDGEGKSILSFNLARYYSSLHIKVLFVSFDTLANPCLPSATEIGWPQMGVEDYLQGEAELEEMVSSQDGVDVIRVQEPRADLLDLAKGAAMPRLWDLIRQNYDLIIAEAPAVLDHPISGTIAGFMDEIIYVLASPVSDRRLVDAGLEFLEDRGMVPRALIFNRVDPYYLEDVRQQRIIRNLAEQKTPVATAPKSTTSDTAEAKQPMDESWDDEELPEMIGGEDIDDLDLLEDKKPGTRNGKGEDEEISFRNWLGDPKNDTTGTPKKDSEDDEK